MRRDAAKCKRGDVEHQGDDDERHGSATRTMGAGSIRRQCDPAGQRRIRCTSGMCECRSHCGREGCAGEVDDGKNQGENVNRERRREGVVAVLRENWIDRHQAPHNDRLVVIWNLLHTIVELAGPSVGSVVRKMIGRASVRIDSLCETVTTRQEVRPMNAVTMWVLPLVFTDRRLT